MKLEGRVALVTGASRGIGAGIARCMAREGAAVVVNYFRAEAAAREVVQEIEASGGRAIAIRVQLTSSPVDRSTSSSRGSGLSETCWASSISSSVVFPMAETTATISTPESLPLPMRRATLMIFSASATELPPYFWTISGKTTVPLHGLD